MNFITTVQFFILAIAVSSTSATSPVRCLTCKGQEECRAPKLLICTQELGKETNEYIKIIHRSKPIEDTSAFECLHETITYPYGQIHYKGCNFQHNAVCQNKIGIYGSIEPDRACEITSGDDNILLNNNSTITLLTKLMAMPELLTLNN